MTKAWTDLPGWVQGLVIAGALGGTNIAQFGLGAPAREEGSVAMVAAQTCQTALTHCYAELRKAHEECR